MDERVKALARRRASRKRERETAEEKEVRLAKGRQRMARLRRAEEPEDAARRREKNRLRVAERRQLATEEEKEKWKLQGRERARLRRESETPEQRSLRREQDRLRMQQKRAQSDEFKVSFSMYMAEAHNIDDNALNARPGLDQTAEDDVDVAMHAGLWHDKPFA
ncbi:hypothetical protein ACHHYP_02844 [Achlya hypogyna]|uniref:Uncharacterized protein n=1 Tax=Achlya hypogyna TaxID=1202772 RepID=A0A1V9Z5A6_ACHHY|nr:hypothetical protein ACHHYP_02844 [Achlya hypogyna]